jgi:paraquat-inducible protein A
MNAAADRAPASLAAATGIDAGLLNCHACGLLSHSASRSAHHNAVATDHDPHCPRCGAVLQARKPASIASTWAYLIAACVLYLPANLLPIMHTSALFENQSDTILSGVVYLWKDGSWALALIVFVASIVIPLAKLIGLGYLLVMVQLRSRRRPRQRTHLFRLIEAVGRWSMLDIYVVALLAALVRLRPLAVIDIGPGAVAFGAVVVLTMLATHAFDPRLIWDVAREADHAPHPHDDE